MLGSADPDVYCAVKPMAHACGGTLPAEIRRLGFGKDVPLIAHVIYRLDRGGLENGLVNLINRISSDRYRHAIICLTDFTDFRFRITQPDVQIYALHKREGKNLGLYVRLWKLLRSLRPHIVHTRNLGTVPCAVSAFLARVPVRVHGEHGWDMVDLHGRKWKYTLIRRICSVVVHEYIPLSNDLARWLETQIRIPKARISRICNGVDTNRFSPRGIAENKLPIGTPFSAKGKFIIGTVGRMQPVKDQLTLARAFVRLISKRPEFKSRCRLVMVGDGPLRDQARDILVEADLGDLVWLPGVRDDIPEFLQAMDVFVLPSLNEGISNTILEAMATAIPVIASKVGGNAELVNDGHTGILVEPSDVEALASALMRYIDDPALVKDHGLNARRCAEQSFSIDAMVAQYLSVYDRLVSP